MKRLGIGLIYSVIFLFLILFFAPKNYLYFALEEELNNNNIVISDETIKDSGLWFRLEGGSLHYDGLKIADLSSMQITPLLFFNRVSVESFTFDSAISQFIKGDIKEAYLQYSIINPLHVKFFAKGSFGEMNGHIGLRSRDVVVELNASKTLIQSRSPLLKFLKKSKEGLYTYESTF